MADPPTTPTDHIKPIQGTPPLRPVRRRTVGVVDLTDDSTDGGNSTDSVPNTPLSQQGKTPMDEDEVKSGVFSTGCPDHNFKHLTPSEAASVIRSAISLNAAYLQIFQSAEAHWDRLELREEDTVIATLVTTENAFAKNDDIRAFMEIGKCHACTRAAESYPQ